MLMTCNVNWWVALRYAQIQGSTGHVIAVAGYTTREYVGNKQVLPDNHRIGGEVNNQNYDRGLDYDS